MRSSNTYPLDCTALMLPYAASKTVPPVFRIAATLRDEIDPDALRQAARELAPRFPTLYTRLRKGFIWDCLTDAASHDIVAEDKEPCYPFPYKDKSKLLLRVLYQKNELAVECSHFTADGTAVMIYLNSLAARYLELRGHEIEKNRTVLHHLDKPAETELADGYRAVYEKPKRKNVPVEGKAFAYLARRKDSRRQITRAEIPIDKLKQLLKEKHGGCSITEYLTAVYALAFLQLYKKYPKQKKPIRFSIPINLRQFWALDTLRNFTGVASVTVAHEQADRNFQDILQNVRRELRENTTLEKMKNFADQSVSYLNMLNIVPGLVKRLVTRAGSPLLGKVIWPYTSSVSNLGYIQLPPSLAEHIQSYMFVLGGLYPARIACAAAGVSNTMTVAFTAVNESAVQDFCIAFFREDGLPVNVTVRNY